VGRGKLKTNPKGRSRIHTVWRLKKTRLLRYVWKHFVVFLQFQKSMIHLWNVVMGNVMNLNRMVMLVWLIQTDEGVQSRLSNEYKSTTLSIPHRDK